MFSGFWNDSVFKIKSHRLLRTLKRKDWSRVNYNYDDRYLVWNVSFWDICRRGDNIILVIWIWDIYFLTFRSILHYFVPRLRSWPRRLQTEESGKWRSDSNENSIQYWLGPRNKRSIMHWTLWGVGIFLYYVPHDRWTQVFVTTINDFPSFLILTWVDLGTFLFRLTLDWRDSLKWIETTVRRWTR